MTLKASTESPEEYGPSSDSNSGYDDQDLPVADHLKDQFGDYSDPQAYDWTWRESE